MLKQEVREIMEKKKYVEITYEEWKTMDREKEIAFICEDGDIHFKPKPTAWSYSKKDELNHYKKYPFSLQIRNSRIKPNINKISIIEGKRHYF